MLFATRIRNAIRSAPAAPPRNPASSGGRADLCPRLEALENRFLFSTLTVTTNGDSGAGSLRDAIAAAQDGDTIVFSLTPTSSPPTSNSPGRGNGKKKTPPPPPPPSTPTITLTSGQLLITKDLMIRGPGAGQLVITGSPLVGTGSRAFEVAEGSSLTLSGLKISGSSDFWTSYPVVTPWAGYGGGVINHGTLAASGCTFTGVVFGYAEGGAIFNDGAMTLSACTVSGALAQGGETRGGGISNWGTATLTNTIVSNNRATATTTYPWFNQGGGIYNQGTMTLNGCTVSNNYSRNTGGGIFNYGTLILSGSTVSDNSAALYAFNVYNAGTMTVKNHSAIYGTLLHAPDYGTGDVNNYGVLNLDDTSTIGVLVGNAAILI